MTEITIAGKRFSIPDRYAEGHKLSANEASALNQLRRENIRNNLAEDVKQGNMKQEHVSEYARTYEFGQAGTRGDPIATEAMAIARKLVREKIRSEGKKLNEYDAEQITALAEKAVDNNPQIIELARKRVKEQQELKDVKF